MNTPQTPRYEWTPRNQTFCSMSEFLDYLANTKASERHNNRDGENENPNRKFSPMGYSEAIEAASHGWLEGLGIIERAKALADATLARVTESRPKKRYDIAGAYPHAARAASGEIMNMIGIGKEHGKRKAYEINVSMSRAGAVPKEYISNISGAIVAQIDMLEAQGTRCTVNAIYENHCTEKAGREFMRITLKDSEQPLELDRFSFALLNASMTRTLCFNWYEKSPWCESWHGMLLPENKCDELRKTMSGIYFPPLSCKYHNDEAGKTPESAQQYVASVFAEYEAKQNTDQQAA